MPRRRTGGGRFDPAAGPLYFLAGGIGNGTPWTFARNVLYGLNESPVSSGDHLELVTADPDVRVLLDSGIFAITQAHARAHAVSMDDALLLPPDRIDGFDQLWDDYVRVVPAFEERLWGYVELDQGGAIHKTATRTAMEKEGLRPIPVYHPLLDGWDYFDELCQRYDRVCFANVVHANYDDRRAILRTMWERHARYPSVWVHALGITPSPLLLAYPPNSCDSSVWVDSVRYGRQYTYTHLVAWPSGRADEYMYNRDVEADDDPRSYHAAAMASAVDHEALRHAWAHHTHSMLEARW